MARFSKDDVHLLYNLLRVPEFYRCPNGTVVGGLESLLLLLRQLIYPNRLSDLCSLFGRPEPELSMIVHKVHSVTYKVPYREMPTSGDPVSNYPTPLLKEWAMGPLPLSNRPPCPQSDLELPIFILTLHWEKRKKISKSSEDCLSWTKVEQSWTREWRRFLKVTKVFWRQLDF